MPTFPLLATLTLLFGLLPLVIRTTALLRPASILTSIFHFPLPTTPYERRLALGLMRVYGSRNVTIGLISVALWSYGQFAVMGWACLAGVIMTVTDGLVARAVVSGKEWTHWGFAPLGMGLGFGLLKTEGIL